MTKHIWKTEKTVYYTRSLQRPNRWGNTETACSRKEITWNVRLPNGRVLEGFDTKREASKAWTHPTRCSVCGKQVTTVAGPANTPICTECETEMMVQL